MSSEYYTEIVFPTSLSIAMEVLVDMQRAIETYKLKDNANEKWISSREDSIVKLMNFIDASKETIAILYKESKEHKIKAFQKGKELGKREANHYKQFGILRKDNKTEREKIRAISILNAQTKYNL